MWFSFLECPSLISLSLHRLRLPSYHRRHRFWQEEKSTITRLKWDVVEGLTLFKKLLDNFDDDRWEGRVRGGRRGEVRWRRGASTEEEGGISR